MAARNARHCEQLKIEAQAVTLHEEGQRSKQYAKKVNETVCPEIGNQGRKQGILGVLLWPKNEEFLGPVFIKNEH